MNWDTVGGICVGVIGWTLLYWVCWPRRPKPKDEPSSPRVDQWLHDARLSVRLRHHEFRIPGTSRTEQVRCYIMPVVEMEQLLLYSEGKLPVLHKKPSYREEQRC